MQALDSTRCFGTWKPGGKQSLLLLIGSAGKCWTGIHVSYSAPPMTQASGYEQHWQQSSAPPTQQKSDDRKGRHGLSVAKDVRLNLYMP